MNLKHADEGVRLARAAVVAAWVTAFALAGRAEALSVFDFTRITSNSTFNAASSLEVTVDTPGSNQVRFQFKNLVAAYPSSFISEIYFDDASPVLLSGTPVIVSNGSGTSFVKRYPPGSVPTFPSGNNAVPPFVIDWAFDTDGGSQSLKGIHPYAASPNDDWVQITFSGDYNNVVTAIDNHSLRIGLHVQGLPLGAGTTSDSFVGGHQATDPHEDQLIPEPLTVAGLTLAAGCLATYLRRRR
jgi:hypothetical protein